MVLESNKKQRLHKLDNSKANREYPHMEEKV